jgi:hypothetical protein
MPESSPETINEWLTMPLPANAAPPQYRRNNGIEKAPTAR